MNSTRTTPCPLEPTGLNHRRCCSLSCDIYHFPHDRQCRRGDPGLSCPQQSDPETGHIPYRTDHAGGHAYAIVGYTEFGFWVQNSWGRNWGINAHLKLDSTIKQFLGNPVWSRGSTNIYTVGGPDVKLRSKSTTHGGFDNDPDTLTSTLRIIRGDDSVQLRVEPTD